MLNELITDLTGWISWPWLQHTLEILIYLGLMMTLAVAPLIAWLVYAKAGTGRTSSRS